MSMTIDDIPRQSAEARIRELEAEVTRLRAAETTTGQLGAILDHSPQAILIHRGAAPLYVNQSFVRLVGLESREEAMALPDSIAVAHPEDQAFVAGQVAARIAGANFLPHYEARICNKQGETIWVDCYASRIVLGNAPASLVTMTDITIRKRIEEAQRRSEKLLSTVFRASPDPISLTTMSEGRYVDVNESFLKALGWRRSDVIGRTAVEIGFWKDASFRPRMVEALKRDGFVRGIPSQVRAPDGEVRDFIYSIDVIHFEDEDLLLGIGRDVTDLKRSADELRKHMEAAEAASRTKSQFLANMSHELRTPLNAILGFSEVIGGELFGPAGDPRYSDYARDIYASGRLLLGIIDDLLDLSRLEHGKLDIRPEAVEAAEIVEACTRLVEGKAREAHVRVVAELPAAPVRLEADALRLKQVLLNLLTNAVKYTPEGGRVTIGVRVREDGEVEFDIADTGIGMTPQEIEIALQPFGQVENALTRHHQGTGLGLPLAKGLVELHGGKLTIESTPRAGTRIAVTLPSTQKRRAA
jgi:PAS domain S-box-containing protein